MIEDVYPLSPLQEGMYYHWLESPESWINFEQISYLVKGELNVGLMEESYAALVSRHGVLRTFFTQEFGVQSLQVVTKTAVPAFQFVDARETASFSMEEFKEADRIRGFDLDKGSQMRLAIVAIGDNSYEFLWSFHHIIMDAWCIGILIQDFFTVYYSLLAGGTPVMAQVYPYSSYIKWLGNIDKDKSLVYWKDYLDGYHTISSMPQKHLDGKAIREPKEAVFTLEKHISQSIKILCGETGITENSFIQAAWGILLSKYNYTDDVVFGSVVSGRPGELEGIEKMVGLFINTIPMRIRVKEKMSVRELFRSVQSDFIEGTDHHYVQLAEIQASSKLGRTLFDHILLFENYPVEEMVEQQTDDNSALSLLSVSMFDQNNYGLTVVIFPGDKLMIKFYYNGSIYEEALIERLKDQLKLAIDQILENPDISISEISFLSPAEKEEIINGFNNTAADLVDNETVVGLFGRSAAEFPEAIAIEYDGSRLNYRELDERSNQFADYLKMVWGTGQDDLVAVDLERSDWLIIAILGILKSGAAYVPLDISYTQKETDLILTDSGCKVIIDEDALTDFRQEQRKYTKDQPEYVVKPGNLAYMSYPYRLTGPVEGVMISHAALLNMANLQKNYFDTDAITFSLQFASPAAEIFALEVFPSLITGATLGIISEMFKNNPMLLEEYISENNTGMVLLPAAYAGTLRTEKLQSVKQLITYGTNPVKDNDPGLSVRCDHTYLYSPAGSGVYATFEHKSNSADHGSIPALIGRPVKNSKLYLMDAGEQLVPRGAIGEMYTGGIGFSAEYLQRHTLLSGKSIANPFVKGGYLFKTGELARWTEDGRVEYAGRKTDLNSAEEYTGKIKNLLLKYKDVKGAVVNIGSGNKATDIIAYIISGTKVNTAQLREYLKAGLPLQILPDYYIQMETFPLKENGEIDTGAFPDIKTIENGKKYIAPRTKTEEELAEIWRLLLGKQQISIKDKFFDLGGQSITATKLASQIHKVFDVKITLKEIFTHTILEDQAILIQKAGKTAVITIPNVPEQVSYPLSSAQRRLWVLSQFEGGNIAYNMPGVYVFEGALNQSALVYAFNTLIDRHESLRTIFKQDAQGEVKQFVIPAAETGFELGYLDIRGMKGQEEYLSELIQDEFLKPFDLTSGPLMRAGLLQVGGNKWIFTYAMHHIITDAWSMGVLIRELLLIYNAYITGGPDPLRSLRIQYKDYSTWQQLELSGDKLKEHRSYWLQQMEGELPILELRGDKVRPAVKTYNGASVHKQIDAKTGKALKDLVHGQDSTLFMGLLSLVYTLLYRYTGQEDIILGSPIAGREDIDLDDQIGFYVNTIALRGRFAGTDSYRELLGKVREMTLNAYDHQVYPFDELVDKLNLQRDVSRNPLFDVQVFLQNTETYHEDGQQDFHDLRVNGYKGTEKKTSVFDIVFNFIEVDEEIHTTIDYNTDIYSNEFIERLTCHLMQLLDAVVARPDVSIARLDYLIQEEKRQLLLDFNITEAAYPKNETVIDLFRKQVLKTPDHIAITTGSHTLSYLELDMQSDQLAGYLLAHHQIQADDLIGIMLDKSVWLIISVLGILKSGAAYVPIDPEYPEERKKFILEDTAVKVLLTQSDYIFDLEYCEAPIFAIDVQFDTIDTAGSTEIKPSVNDLAYVIYTSGSTGNPKGVMIEHRSLTNLCYWHNERFSVTDKDRATLYAGVAFDASVWEFFPYITTGASLYIIPSEIRLEVERLSAYYESNEITISFLPTQIGEQFMELDNHSLRYLLVGGDKLTNFTPKAYKVVNNYGPTETTVVASSFLLTGHISSIPIGKPVSNTHIYILDEHQGLCPPGVSGEICIGGEGLARGYLNQDQLTTEKFVTDPFKKNGLIYKTGDLGRWLSDGNIEFTGRKDDQVKIRGYRIELGEIETVLRRYAIIDSAVVVARDNKISGKELVAYLTSSEALDFQSIRQHLNVSLPSFMIPAHFVQLDKLPLNASGKVDKKGLPEPNFEEIADDYVAPEDENELLLADIWQEALGLDKIGIHDNFFSIGGNSITAIGIQAKARGKGLVLTMQQMFETPTIARLAKVMVRSSQNRSVEEEVTGTMELLPVQQWYFDHQTNDIHHFNYSTMMAVPGDFSEHDCREMINALYKRHDALRLRFQLNENVRKAFHEPLSEGLITSTLEICSCDGMEAAERLDFVNNFAALAQTGLRLAEGLLFKMVWFDYGDKKDGRLLLIVHHLVVDGVSWRILLEDINLMLAQTAQKRPVVLAPKTDSYKRWSEVLKKYSNTKQLMQQRSYWQSVLQLQAEPFPVGKKQEIRIVRNQKRVGLELDELSTYQLVHQSSKAYHTQINDLLLTALLNAISQWGNIGSFLIDLEGHGRVSLPDNPDVSQTVGWFTNIYPVFLDKRGIDFNSAEGTGLGIKKVKENLRAIPDNGIGFGILRYLTRDISIIQSEKEHKAAVLFNYLGDFKSINNDLTAELVEESTGPAVSDGQKSFYALEFNGAIVGGQLNFVISYIENEYNADQIEHLATVFKQSLQLLISHTLEIENTHYTPSDFPLAVLDQNKVEEIEKNFPELQDIYPATSIQKGIFFYSLVANVEGGYVNQQHGVLKNINSRIFKNSWEQLLERHSILRTSFRICDTNGLLQVVSKSTGLPYTYIDLKDSKDTEQSARIQELIKMDAAQDFDFEQAPMLRITMIQINDADSYLILTFHHIALDGWSIPILYNELNQIYNAELNRVSLKLPPVLEYREYIKWLSTQNNGQLQKFWSGELKGVVKATKLSAVNTLGSGGVTGYGEVSARLTPDVSAELKKQAAHYGVTLNTLFVAAWGLVLSNFTNEKEVIFGMTVSGRGIALDGIESVVGLFINSIPVKVKCINTQELGTWLKDLQQYLIEIDKHSALGLAEIQNTSGLDKEEALFESLLVHENYPVDEAAQNGVSSNVIDFNAAGIKDENNFPVTLQIDSNEAIFFMLRYKTEIFDDLFMTDLIASLKEIMLMLSDAKEDCSLKYFLLKGKVEQAE